MSAGRARLAPRVWALAAAAAVASVPRTHCSTPLQLSCYVAVVETVWFISGAYIEVDDLLLGDGYTAFLETDGLDVYGAELRRIQADLDEQHPDISASEATTVSLNDTNHFRIIGSPRTPLNGLADAVQLPSILNPFKAGVRFRLPARPSDPLGTVAHFQHMTLWISNASFADIHSSGFMEFFSISGSSRLCVSNSDFVVDGCDGFPSEPTYLWCCTQHRCNITYSLAEALHLGLIRGEARALTCRSTGAAHGLTLHLTDWRFVLWASMIICISGACFLTAAAAAAYYMWRVNHRSQQNKPAEPTSPLSSPQHGRMLPDFSHELACSSCCRLCTPTGGATPLPCTCKANSAQSLSGLEVSNPLAAVASPTQLSSTALSAHLALPDDPSPKGGPMAPLLAVLERMERDGELLLSKYGALPEAGLRAGSTGGVCFAVHVEEGAVVALKFFHTTAAFRAEARLLESCADTVLLSGVEHCEGVSASCGFQFPPFSVQLAGEPIMDYFARTAPHKDAMLQVLLGFARKLCEVHRAGVVHGSLKIGNLVIIDRSVWGAKASAAQSASLSDPQLYVLTDYSSASLNKVQSRHWGGVRHCSPQLVGQLQRGADIIPKPTDDVWAFGIVLFRLLADIEAYEAGLDDAQVGHQILSGAEAVWEAEVTRPVLDARMHPVAEVVHQALSRNPAARPSIADVVCALERLVAAADTQGSSCSTKL